MFYRRATDGTRQPLPLENQFAGPMRTPCWIIGGGPSLSQSAAEQIDASPAPKFAINLAGSGLLRPTFWTSYDPTVRFHRSVYLDPSVMKFVHESRAMDLIPETTFKVCEAPNLYFIDRAPLRGFHDFPGVGSEAITDWQDSLIQAIDIAYRLGFRELYLAGCDMWIAPSKRWQAAAKKAEVSYLPREPLADYVRRCGLAGLSREEIEQFSSGRQYHFPEAKPLGGAVQTDSHYFRITQTLRLCRRSLGLAGLELVSVTPGSRLNDHFPFLSVAQAARRIKVIAGDPSREETQGRYTEVQRRQPAGHSSMKDVRPHFWPGSNASKGARNHKRAPEKGLETDPFTRLQQAVEDLPEIAVDV